MSLPKFKRLDVNNMVNALKQLYSAQHEDIDELVNSGRAEDLRTYLNETVFQSGNQMTTSEAGSFSGTTVSKKSVTNDTRNNRDVVLQSLVYFMAKVDQKRRDDLTIDTQFSGTLNGLLVKYTGHDIVWLENIRKVAGIGFIAPFGVAGNGSQLPVFSWDAPKQTVKNSAQKKSEARKKASAEMPSIIPQIQLQSAEGVNDPEDRTEPAQNNLPVLPLVPLSVSDCMVLEPKRYILNGLIEAGTITLVSGMEKIGKTYVLKHMALSMSARLPWLGRATMEDVDGGVLWLNLDMSRSLGKRRIYEIAHGLEESFDVRKPDLFQNFYMMDNMTFREANRDMLHFFTDNNAVDGLTEFIHERNISVCFIDNLIQVEGDAQENVSNDIRKVFNRIKEMRDGKPDLSLILVHHTDKAGNRGRGSSDIFAETDLNLQLDPDKDNPKKLLLNTDGARNSDSNDIGMIQQWEQRIDDNGQPMNDANGHPVYIYKLNPVDVNTITTAKLARSEGTKSSATISNNIELIKDLFQNNGNKPLSQSAIIREAGLTGAKQAQINSVKLAVSTGVLKTNPSGLLLFLNDYGLIQ